MRRFPRPFRLAIGAGEETDEAREKKGEKEGKRRKETLVEASSFTGPARRRAQSKRRER